LKIAYPTRKLAPKREGPFSITEVLSPLSYRLKLPSQWRIHPVFHAALLSPYRETNEHGPNFLEPPPDLIEGEKEYEVEAIIAHKKVGRTTRYLVKWKDYPTSENSWEPEGFLKNASNLLLAYKRKKNLD
jgi:hypothetical protein